MKKILTPSPAAASRRAASQLLVVRREEPIKTNHRALVAAFFIGNDEGTVSEIRDVTAVLPGTITNIVSKFCADGLLGREQIATQIGVPRILYYPKVGIEEYGNQNHPVYKGLRYFTVGFRIDKSTTPWACRRSKQ